MESVWGWVMSCVFVFEEGGGEEQRVRERSLGGARGRGWGVSKRERERPVEGEGRAGERRVERESGTRLARYEWKEKQRSETESVELHARQYSTQAQGRTRRRTVETMASVTSKTRQMTQSSRRHSRSTLG